MAAKRSPGFVALFFVNLYFNLGFYYPRLVVKYQGDSEAASGLTNEQRKWT